MSLRSGVALFGDTTPRRPEPAPPSTVDLWRRFLAGKRLTPDQERVLRRADPVPAEKKGYTFGPGVTSDVAARMPCYTCGSRLRPGVDPATARLLMFAAPKVAPEGRYRLCRRCWGQVTSFDAVERLHAKRYAARELSPRWSQLVYYHPRIARERF